MSLKLNSSSASGSDTEEEIESSSTDQRHHTNIKRRNKLGAQFFPDESNPTTTANRPKTPSGRSGLKKTWTMPSTRSRAALWPSDTTDPDDTERNNNGSTPVSSFPRNETPGNYEGAQVAHSDELAIVTEQLQIIQETQDLILSELRSDIESLQTENLCLQHNNSRLRIQVDHLNELVYELSKELNLMREFVNARKGQTIENNEYNAERLVSEHVRVVSSSSIAKNDEKKKAKAVADPARKKAGENSKSKDLLVDDNDCVKSGPSRSRSTNKHRDKAASSKKPEKKKDHEKKVKTQKNSGNKRFGFISSIFRPRKPRSPTPSMSGSQSQQE